MNAQSPASLLPRDELLLALAALGEDPRMSRVDQLRERIDASTLPTGDRETAVRAAVDAARRQLDADAAPLSTPQTGIRTVYCIGRKAFGIPGADWFDDAKDRAAEEAHGHDIWFDLDVPGNASKDDITVLVDNAMWGESYLAGAPECRAVNRKLPENGRQEVAYEGIVLKYGDNVWPFSNIEAANKFLARNPNPDEAWGEDADSKMTVKFDASTGTLVELKAAGKLPEHEYAFDCTLDAAIRVKGTSREAAEASLRAAMDAADCNGGAWPGGEPIRFEASVNDSPLALYELDGEAVSDVGPEKSGAALGSLSHEEAALLLRALHVYDEEEYLDGMQERSLHKALVDRIQKLTVAIKPAVVQSPSLDI